MFILVALKRLIQSLRMSLSKHRSPGLTAIFNAVKTSQKNQILDLGSSISANFNFFTQLGCRFHFENFDETLAEMRKGELNPQTLIETFLKYIKPDQRFDIVLLWDLFNYLDKTLMQKLYAKLEQFLKPNSLIFSLSYVGSKRPDSPAQFRILDQYFIEINNESALEPNALRSTTVQSLRDFPNFFILRSYLGQKDMRRGVSEQISAFKPEKTSTKASFSNAEMSQQSSNELKLRSPSISLLRDKLVKGEIVRNVLDLGGRNDRSEEQWQQTFDSVYCADLKATLRRLSALNTEERRTYLDEGHYLRFERSQRFDLIMCWDLLNYCDVATLTAIGKRLSLHANPGCLILCINYTANRLPSEPRNFVLTEDGIGIKKKANMSLVDRSQASLSSFSLQKLFPGFFAYKSFSSQPGMLKGTTEFLLIHKDSATLDEERARMTQEVMARRREREARGK
jgi:SAM-dependent methyltransferase